jgi:DNA-binding transcriptional ArsR family regulator
VNDATVSATLRDMTMRAWAERFALLGDLSRLHLLLTIRDDGPICVTDLAAATGLKAPTVSQALRLLRAHDMVAARRDGRTKLYELTDSHVDLLLEHLADRHHLTEPVPAVSTVA